MMRPPSAGTCSRPRKLIRHSARETMPTVGRSASRTHCGAGRGSDACPLPRSPSSVEFAEFAASLKRVTRPFFPLRLLSLFLSGHALPGVAHTRDHAALLCVLLFILLTARPHAFERGDFQLLPPVGYVALVERVSVPALATRALEAGVRARLFLRQRQTRPRAARRVAAPALDLDQQHLPREHGSFGHAQLRKRSAEVRSAPVKN